MIPNINIKDYDYFLPDENIALYPLTDRSASRMVFARCGTNEISHMHFSDLPDLLPENSLLILNSTKVIAARMKMLKPTGGKAEILCITPVRPSHDPQVALAAKNTCTWKCMAGGRRIQPGAVLAPETVKEDIRLSAKILSRDKTEAIVQFDWDGDCSFAQIIDQLGSVPLPPYIKRDADEKDKSTYQTVYATSDGSVAAPTAGLHFTPQVLAELSKKGIRKSELVLHVGPGTFKPVETDDISGHDMHFEQVFITRQTIDDLLGQVKQGNPIIATGTTSLRTIESLYWLGSKLILGARLNDEGYFEIYQDEPYVTSGKSSASDALEFLVDLMESRGWDVLCGQTQLFIVPGYDFKIVTGLITNFHLPKSTLILLVAAFTGKELWRKIYEEALLNNYRFLSYGDSSLLLR